MADTPASEPDQSPPPDDGARVAEVLQRDVRALLRALHGSAVEEIRLERGGVRIALRRAWEAPAPGQQPLVAEVAATEAAAPLAPQAEVRAHIVGVFHRSREPDGPALVQEGDRVEAGRALGVIETLGMSSDVEAPVPGRLEQFAVEDGSPVEFGHLLALIAPE